LDFKITDVNRKLNVKNLFASDGNQGGHNNDEQPRRITKKRSFIDKVGMRDIKVGFSLADEEQGMQQYRIRSFPNNNKYNKIIKNRRNPVGDVTGARKPNIKSEEPMKDTSARVIFAKEIEAHRLAQRQPNRKVTNEFHFGNGSRENVTYGSHHDTGSDTRALRVGTDGSG
jgi:hypothetical protein